MYSLLNVLISGKKKTLYRITSLSFEMFSVSTIIEVHVIKKLTSINTSQLLFRLRNGSLRGQRGYDGKLDATKPKNQHFKIPVAHNQWSLSTEVNDVHSIS